MIKISQITDPVEQRRVIESLATPRKWDIMTVQCLYYGHSFVHRYQSWVNENRRYKDGGLRNGELNMLFHSDGGAPISRLLDQSNLEAVERLAPDAVIVEVGTIDLAKEDCRPCDLLDQVVKLIAELKDRRVRYIVINSVIFRGKNGYKGKKGERLACKNFKNKVIAYNLRAPTVINKITNCMFWKHPGMWQDIESCVLEDGTHLNALGQYKLYNSLRSVCMRVVRRTKPCLYRK